MVNRGRMVYVPDDILQEANIIRESQRLRKRKDAFIAMVKYSRVGREAERLFKLDFTDMWGSKK